MYPGSHRVTHRNPNCQRRWRFRIARNAPVVDDSLDRLPVGERLAAARKRLAELIWPGELGAPSPAPTPIRDAG